MIKGLFNTREWTVLEREYLLRARHDILTNYRNVTPQPDLQELGKKVFEGLRQDVPNLKRSDTYTVRNDKGLDIFVPFTGNKLLFYVKPTTFNPSTPVAPVVTDNALKYSFEVLTESSAEKIKKYLTEHLTQVEQYLVWLKKDVDAYHEKLHQVIDKIIEEIDSKVHNKAKSKIIDKVANDLGFTIKG